MMQALLNRMIDKGRQALTGNAALPMAAHHRDPFTPSLNHNFVPERVKEAPEVTHPRGASIALQDDALFKDLCDADYFALGERDGIRSPDHEALAQGLARIVARARLVFDHMVQVRIACLDEAELRQISVGQQGSGLDFERLRAKTNAWRRDIETLKQQRELAGEGQGWVEPLLVDYRAGFQRSIRESMHAHWLR